MSVTGKLQLCCDVINLGTLGGYVSAAAAVNNRAEVVGAALTSRPIPDASCDGPICHSFLWEKGAIIDLQSLLLPGSGITLDCGSAGGRGCVGAYNINDRGKLPRKACSLNGETRAFLLIPCDQDHRDVHGCEYDMVDASAATRNSPVPSVTPAHAAGPFLGNRSGRTARYALK